MNNTITRFTTLLFACCLLTQCSPAQKAQQSVVKNIPAYALGHFTDDYNIRYTITDTLWTQHSEKDYTKDIRYHIIQYDTAGQYFIARNDAKNPSEAGLYTRIDIMPFLNMQEWEWGFCLTTYNAKTMEEAIAAASADRNNPRKGCGGYPFSRMRRKIDNREK